jgi:hypothetical protein
MIRNDEFLYEDASQELFGKIDEKIVEFPNISDFINKKTKSKSSLKLYVQLIYLYNSWRWYVRFKKF